MMRIARPLCSLTLATALGGCWSGIYENPAAQYVHRSDTVTLSAGNAKDVNAAIHVIDPWPPYVGNRRIPGDGGRMVGAVERYQRPQTGRSPGPGQGPGQGGQPVNPSDAGGTPAGGSSGAAVPAATLRY
jgi:hypothetical protein